jgi:hypothetical protein
MFSLDYTYRNHTLQKEKEMSKSYVSMEQKQCPVCGLIFDSGAILLDKRLRQSMKRNTVTGYGLCPEHQELFDKGYIALVEATSPSSEANLKLEEVNRTGKICHLKRSAADNIFNIKLPDKIPMIFVEPGVIDKLQTMTESEE